MTDDEPSFNAFLCCATLPMRKVLKRLGVNSFDDLERRSITDIERLSSRCTAVRIRDLLGLLGRSLRRTAVHNDQQRALAEKRRDQVARLRSSGASWREIGDQFGVTPQRAYQLGNKKPPRGLTPRAAGRIVSPCERL